MFVFVLLRLCHSQERYSSAGYLHKRTIPIPLYTPLSGSKGPVHKEPARSLASRPVMPTNLKSVDRLIFHGLLALLPVIACTINVVDYKTEGFYSQGLSASLRCLGYLQSPLASHFVIIPETFTGPGCIHHSFRGPSRSLRCIPRTFEYLANPSSNLTEPYMRYNKTYGSRRAMQGNSN